MPDYKQRLNGISGLICYWDFEGNEPLRSKGPNAYVLVEGNGSIGFVKDDVTIRNAVDLKEGQYLYIKREDCPALNVHGPQAQITVISWIKRQPKSYKQCEAIAGMWNETEKFRQYCLFLNLRLHDSSDQVGGHISGVGGPTPGQKWCMDAAIGHDPVIYNQWSFAGFTYDSKLIRSYLNGQLDSRAETNPYPYEEGIFDGGLEGSDFTVGAVHRLGEMGNNFVGQIGFLAVFNRALTDAEIQEIYQD
ncbi:hypothetical protein ADIARSV_2538 [Arcticibacter svalbardensis MN12-7]|uniref:LamG-like jellyroll fold domain-containing protein n=1 Tax=Arcticibacter svalbardensis MN12-7 TaxID=1150600 RepID=R9GR28_9SPHI|nr:LamG-like jellyroll fold domain-containing protein [Arcticibacter svalbardensis]EOR94297.1 hypothetical protein ADIARSV_2538 [Arcticibacter svalbardensis MN12-7]